MNLARVVILFATALLAVPAAAQEGCKVGAQSASAAAQDYRLAVGKVRTSCTKSASNCDQLRAEAEVLLEALIAANDVMQEACKPGSGGGTTPGPGELVITEIMVDPVAVGDEYGEWIEVYNPTSRALDLSGLTLATEQTPTPGTPHTITTSVVVPAGGYIVLGRSMDPMMNGGVAVSYAYSGLELPNLYAGANEGNYLLTISHGAVVIDSVYVTDRIPHMGGTEAFVPGRSRNLTAEMTNAVDNDQPAYWCNGNTSYGDGDFGTPGYGNLYCSVW